MSSTYARRRVATRLTRSTSSKSRDGIDDNIKSVVNTRTKSSSKSASPPTFKDDIPVPQEPSAVCEGEDPSNNADRAYSISSSISSGHDIFTHEAAHTFHPPTSSAAATGADFLPSTPSTPSSRNVHHPSYDAVFTPSRSTFTLSSSVSSKRKASGEIDPNSLRRSVRQRGAPEASPFRADSTEAQRDSTLFISQPRTPSKLHGGAPTNRKDSLFMSLPASFGGGGAGEANNNDAQYAPIFDLSLLSANSTASCFLPMDGKVHQYSSTTPAQEPPASMTGLTDFSPPFDFLQYNDFIAPFPSTPQPAFLNFPPTPTTTTTRFSGSFNIAPLPLHSNGSNTPASAHFPVMPLQAVNLQKVPFSPVVIEQQQPHQSQHYTLETVLPKTPLNPTRPLPRRARKSSACSSNAGSIIVKDIEEEEEEEEEEATADDDEAEEGDATAQPGDMHNGGTDQQQEEEEEDERFALFASQVRRKAEAMSLKSSQGAAGGMTSSPAPGACYLQGYDGNNAEYNDNSGRQAGFDEEEEAGRYGGDNGAGASFMPKQDQIELFNLPPMPEPLPPLPAQYRTENDNYADQYSTFRPSEDSNMGVSPNKPVKPKRGHHNKNRGDKPPRPRNCFILYRSDKVEEIRKQAQRDKMQKDISKIVAELWRSEPQSVKDEYARRADIEREEHLIKYPGYVYQPTRKDKPAEEEPSPLKRSGSARPRNANGSQLSRSTPASAVARSRFTSSTEEEEDMSEFDERSKSPSPSKASRSRTPLRQSRIPVPASVNKGSTYSTPAKKASQIPVRQLSIPVSTQRPVQSAKRATAIAKNAADFASQRGLAQTSARTMPASSRMSKSQSTPSNVVPYHTSSVAQTPSAPRYAKPTAASMSKSFSQPLPAMDQSSRSTPVHPQHQYAAYSHIKHPLPQGPLPIGPLHNGTLEQTMTSTPVDQQRIVFPDMSTQDASIREIGPAQGRLSTTRPIHQRSQTFQPMQSTTSASDTPSRVPSMRRMKTSPPQTQTKHNEESAGAIPDGFVIGGKLYPYDNVEEAMKAYQASTVQKPLTRIASNHSTNSNGPVQEIMMPAQTMYSQQQLQSQIPMQYCAQPGQNYVIGVAPDGQQIPLLLSQPESVTTYQPWQSVPAFMPSSTQATPSTGFAYEFAQSADPLQQFDYNSLYTPNTANSNMSNMPLSGTNWFPQQSPSNQGLDSSQYLITNDPTLGGTSPTFYLNDANGQQQAYTLAGPSVSVEVGNDTTFAPMQETFQQQWTSA